MRSDREVAEMLRQQERDTALGAALRAALATVPGGAIEIDQWNGDPTRPAPIVSGISADAKDVENGETRALARALATPTEDATP